MEVGFLQGLANADEDECQSRLVLSSCDLARRVAKVAARILVVARIWREMGSVRLESLLINTNW